MTQALEIISTEHRSMWQLTVVLEELCKHCAEPEHKPDAELFDLILDYIEQYVERVHEPKEETYLYRAVLERSSEGNDMIAQLPGFIVKGTIDARGLGQLVRAHGEVEAVGKRPRAALVLSERFGVAVRALGADFRAAAHGVPSQFGPGNLGLVHGGWPPSAPRKRIARNWQLGNCERGNST